MQKIFRKYLPDIFFFCVTFIAISVLLQSQYKFFSGIQESILLKFDLHFSRWTEFYRSFFTLFADILITSVVFLIARFTCCIQRKSGKSKLITISIPVVSAMALLFFLCEIQVFRREDFWEVQYARELGLFKFMELVLKTEGGRFFSYFVKGINSFFASAQASMIYMNTCLFISLLILFFGLYRLLLILFKTSVFSDQFISEKKQAFFLAFCLFSAILFTSPKIWEDWFWDAGGLIFGIGISLSVLSFSLITEHILCNETGYKKMILPVLILFIACGCNQITTLAADILITEVLLYVLVFQRNMMSKRRVLHYFLVAAAASVICMLAPGNFYRLENGSFTNKNLSEMRELLGQWIPKLSQQISVNIVMMKSYWVFLILVCFFFGLIIRLRNRKRLLLMSAGMFTAGTLSLSLNVLLDYMPARIYAAAFIWIALSFALCFIVTGSLFHDIVKKTVLPARIRSSYIFLAVFISFCPVFFLYYENHDLLCDIRSAWFYRDEQIRSIPGSSDETRGICGVPVIETSWTDIRFAEAFIANYYGLNRIEDAGACPPFSPFSEDPARWR